MQNQFFHTCRVYYGDTDCGGVVYYANYLRFIEYARIEFFLFHNIPLEVLEKTYNVVAVIKKIDAQYLYPARLGNLLKVGCCPISYRRATIVMQQDVYLIQPTENEDRKIFTCQVELTCVDTIKFKPIVIPEILKPILIACGAREEIR
ncbi:MAG: YbgC/FadM family acyl-CoA thioesterase [Methylacidiphilales bacterium]|nr:YbgC/FadM family acyl-CoA thioesterase [Candidatus Methylacidiphilales bacterium]